MEDLVKVLKWGVAIAMLFLAVLVIAIITFGYRGNTQGGESVLPSNSQAYDSLLRAKRDTLNGYQLDVVLINKEKDEVIKSSRSLNDSAAVELFKKLVAE